MTIPCFDAFSIKKRHFYQPTPFSDFAEQNEDRNQLGWQLENPMNFLMKKRRSPFFGPNPYWLYQDSALGLQNKVKTQGSIGVEITEPIVRPISSQDFAEQNEAKKTMGLQNEAKKQGSIGVDITEPIVRYPSYQAFPEQNEAKKHRSIGVEIREPIVRPYSYQDSFGQNEDMGLQNYAKRPEIIGVEIKEPVVRPVNLEEPLVISHDNVKGPDTNLQAIRNKVKIQFFKKLMSLYSARLQ